MRIGVYLDPDGGAMRAMVNPRSKNLQEFQGELDDREGGAAIEFVTDDSHPPEFKQAIALLDSTIAFRRGDEGSVCATFDYLFGIMLSIRREYGELPPQKPPLTEQRQPTPGGLNANL